MSIPESPDELFLYVLGKEIRIGKIQTILHPPPTPLPTMTPSSTITLTHTVTSTPTNSPTPIPSGKVLAGEGGFINIRSGPSVNHPVAFQLSGQSEFMVFGKNETNDWLYIQSITGDYGWVRIDLIQFDYDISLLALSTEIVPTLTPAPTKTPTPTPTIPRSQLAPKGVWCGQNSSRGVCVGNLDYRNYVGYSSASQNARFIVMGISVLNIGSSQIFLLILLILQLLWKTEVTFDHASQTYYFDNAMSGVTVSPGNSASGIVVFYVPKDVGPKIITCRGGLFETKIEIDFDDPPKEE